MPGGELNVAGGAYSFAAGRRAKANHTGAFVWADSTYADFASTSANQFNVRAGGGVRFETGGAGVRVDGNPLLAGPVPDSLLSSNVALRAGGNAFTGNQTIMAGHVGIGTPNPLMSLHVASAATPASMVIGQSHESGGYAALLMGVGAVSDSYAYLQGVRAAGISYGNLVLNPGGGRVGIGTTTPARALHVLGDALFEQDYGRLVLRTPGRNHPSRFGIEFQNNLLAPFHGDDTQEQTFSFFSGFSDHRTYDAKLRVHGRATSDYNRFVELTHDGTTGQVGTDAAALELRPGNQRGLRLEPTAPGAPNIIGGSPYNTVAAGVVAATISGGGATNYGSGFVGGGGAPISYINRIAADFSTIGGGGENNIETASFGSVVGGGLFNRVEPNAFAATISGGAINVVASNAFGAVIAGGRDNYIGTNGSFASIGGGSNNLIAVNADSAVIAGGMGNTIAENAFGSTLGGGHGNEIRTGAFLSAILGGYGNEIGSNAPGSFIGSGTGNRVRNTATNAVIPGGYLNEVGGSYGFASGRRAKALHSGTFVWADSHNADFASTAANQFLIRAAGGVGIGTSNPKDMVELYHTNGGFLRLDGGLNNNIGIRLCETNGLRWTMYIRGWEDEDLEFYDEVGHRTTMLLKSGTGRVGIGVDAPQSPLHVAGTVTATAFAGSGSGLTGIPTGALADGSVTSAKIADGTVTPADVNAATFNTTFWRATGNAGTTPTTHYLGTTDNQPLELKVNGLRALRLEPGGFGPNVIGGFGGNYVGGSVSGATIGGGGYLNNSNVIDANVGTVAGGMANKIDAMSQESTISGGSSNTVSFFATATTIAGGHCNGIGPRASASVIGGGKQNTIAHDSTAATIAGGELNYIGLESGAATIAGGESNKISSSAGSSTIAGGWHNRVDLAAWAAALGGGADNMAQGSYATIPGGDSNLATNYAFAAGRRAKAQHTGAFVWADSTDADFASTGNNQFLIRASGGVGIGGAPQDTLLHVEGDIRLNNHDLFLRHESDRNHGLGWYGTHYINKPFAGVDVDGPVLYGWNGGVLGSTYGGDKVALRWMPDGRVGINTTNPVTSLHVASSSGPASVLIGQNNEGGGYTTLTLGVNAVSSSYAYLQAVGVSGVSWGNLILNANGGNVGIGTNGPAQKLHVAGRIRMGTWTGDGTTAVYRNASGDLGLQSSDRRLKENIAPITNALAAVRGLTGVTFNWRGEPADAGKTVGLIAQDVQAALPELTFECQGEDGETYLGVHYEKVAVVLANAVNELHDDFAAKLDRKDAEIQELTQRLARLEALVQQLAQ